MSEKFRRVFDQFFVSAQIDASDIESAKASGIKTIINNRPDGEAPGQPSGATIQAAAEAASLNYVAIPVSGAIAQDHLDAFREACADGGPTLAYCASGTRSIIVYAYHCALTGQDPSEILENARQAGYDISTQLPALETLYRASQQPTQ